MNSHSEYLQRRHFGSLDGIRFASIMAVLWHHTMPFWDKLPGTSRGFLGVDMFFVLSGFLIVTLLLREDDRNGEISLKKFYMRRTFRIFPLYYGVLILFSILFFVVARNNDMASEFRANAPYYFTYTSNWIHDVSFLAVTWSLATEEQFYLIWPPLQKYLKKWSLLLLGVALVVNQLINFGKLFPEKHAELEILQSTFTPIIFGVFLAYALHNRTIYDFLNRFLGDRWSSLIFFGSLCVVLNIPPVGIDISGITRLVTHFLMVLLLLSMILREDHVLAPIAHHPFVIRMGQISYGVYLLHMIVRHFAGSVLSRIGFSAEPSFLLFVIVLIGTVILSELSFRFYEAPFLKLKNRWSSH